MEIVLLVVALVAGAIWLGQARSKPQPPERDWDLEDEYESWPDDDDDYEDDDDEWDDYELPPRKKAKPAPEKTLWTGSYRLIFEYQDSKGDVSQRDLLLERVYEKRGVWYFRGYSLLREASRTFRCDRITPPFANGDTGEVVKLADVIDVDLPDDLRRLDR